jgi:hypothetical protein
MLGYAIRCPDEVDIGDAPLRVEIYASEETVEIFVEADLDPMPEESRRLRFSIFPAICLAKPPPQRPDVPRTPSCILAVTSDFATRAEFKSAVPGSHDPLA